MKNSKEQKAFTLALDLIEMQPSAEAEYEHVGDSFHLYLFAEQFCNETRIVFHHSKGHNVDLKRIEVCESGEYDDHVTEISGLHEDGNCYDFYSLSHDGYVDIKIDEFIKILKNEKA